MTVTDNVILGALILFLVGLIIQTSIANSILASENRILQAECSHNANEICRLEKRIADLEEGIRMEGFDVPPWDDDEDDDE